MRLSTPEKREEEKKTRKGGFFTASVALSAYEVAIKCTAL